MVKSIKLLFFCWFCFGWISIVHSQFGFSVDTVYINPENPDEFDNIEVVIQITSFSNMDYDSCNFLLSNYSVEIESCFGLGPTGVSQTIIDTVFLGQLSSGNHDLNFRAFASYASQPYCDTWSDSGSYNFSFFVESLGNFQSESKCKLSLSNLNGSYTVHSSFTNTLNGVILDINGSWIHEFDIENGKTQIGLDNYQSGIYFLQIQTESSIEAFRIIKQR